MIVVRKNVFIFTFNFNELIFCEHELFHHCYVVGLIVAANPVTFDQQVCWHFAKRSLPFSLTFYILFMA